MGVLIFCTTFYNSFSIWLYIYFFHLSDLNRTYFMIVESLYPMVFSAITLPSQSESAPITSGSIPLYCSLRVFEAVLTALTLSPLVTSFHNSLRQISQRILYYVPLLLSMWCTLHAGAAKDPFLSKYFWCKVFPIIPFF